MIYLILYFQQLYFVVTDICNLIFFFLNVSFYPNLTHVSYLIKIYVHHKLDIFN